MKKNHHARRLVKPWEFGPWAGRGRGPLPHLAGMAPSQPRPALRHTHQFCDRFLPEKRALFLISLVLHQTEPTTSGELLMRNMIAR
jgi:hypothetical protein